MAVLRHQRAKRRRGNAGRGAAEAQRRSADSDAATGCCCRWAWAAVCAAEHPMAPPPLRARRVTGPRAPPTPGRQRPPRGGDSDRRTRPPHAKTHTASTRAARGHAQREQDGHTGLGDTRCQEKNTTSRSPQNAQGRAPIRLRTTGGSNGTRARACENIPANRRWQARPTGSAKIARVERRRVAARTKHHWARGVGVVQALRRPRAAAGSPRLPVGRWRIDELRRRCRCKAARAAVSRSGPVLRARLGPWRRPLSKKILKTICMVSRRRPRASEREQSSTTPQTGRPGALCSPPAARGGRESQIGGSRSSSAPLPCALGGGGHANLWAAQ